MSTSLSPYNFTITDNSPLFSYTPVSGAANESWVLSFSSSSDSSWSPQNNLGSGTSSHTAISPFCDVTLQWTGTAVVLYGNAEPNSYTSSIDHGSLSIGAGSSSGVLVSYSGLAYGQHMIDLSPEGGSPVSLTGATITVGMGAPGTTVQTRNISVVTSNDQPSSFFDAPSWVASSSVGETSTVYSTLQVSTPGATMKFTLNSTSAFAILGYVNWNLGQYNVTVTPSGGPPVTNSFNASSKWAELDQVLYFQAGMDQTQTYTVEVINESGVDVHSIVLYDTVLSASVSVSPTSSSASHTPLPGEDPSTTMTHRGALSKAAVGGVVIASIGAIIFLVLLWKRRRWHPRYKSQRDQVILTPTQYMLRQGTIPASWTSDSSPGDISFTSASPRRTLPRTPPLAQSLSSSLDNPASRRGQNRSVSETSGGGITVIREIDAGPAHFTLIPPPEYAL